MAEPTITPNSRVPIRLLWGACGAVAALVWAYSNGYSAIREQLSTNAAITATAMSGLRDEMRLSVSRLELQIKDVQTEVRVLAAKQEDRGEKQQQR